MACIPKTSAQVVIRIIADDTVVVDRIIGISKDIDADIVSAQDIADAVGVFGFDLNKDAIAVIILTKIVDIIAVFGIRIIIDTILGRIGKPVVNRYDLLYRLSPQGSSRAAAGIGVNIAAGNDDRLSK